MLLCLYKLKACSRTTRCAHLLKRPATQNECSPWQRRRSTFSQPRFVYGEGRQRVNSVIDHGVFPSASLTSAWWIIATKSCTRFCRWFIELDLVQYRPFLGCIDRVAFLEWYEWVTSKSCSLWRHVGSAKRISIWSCQYARQLPWYTYLPSVCMYEVSYKPQEIQKWQMRTCWRQRNDNMGIPASN